MIQIQIQQTYAKIGIQQRLGQYDIEQPKASIEIRQPRGEQEIHSPSGKLTIDSSRAWSALGVGSNLRWMDHIHDVARDIALQSVGRIAEKGDRLAAIHEGGNPIPDLARQGSIEFLEFEYPTPASVDNVDVSYEAASPDIQYTPRPVEINVKPNAPQIAYRRGGVDISMLQYNSIQIDVKV